MLKQPETYLTFSKIDWTFTYLDLSHYFLLRLKVTKSVGEAYCRSPGSHTLLYARISRNRQKVRQFGVLCPIPQLALAGNHTLAALGLEERRNFEELLTESVGRVHFP
jgi:hypothetical protein